MKRRFCEKSFPNWPTSLVSSAAEESDADDAEVGGEGVSCPDDAGDTGIEIIWSVVLVMFTRSLDQSATNKSFNSPEWFVQIIVASVNQLITGSSSEYVP